MLKFSAEFYRRSTLRCALFRVTSSLSPSFVLLLSLRACVQDERPFSAEEEEKLQGALGLEAKDLELVIDTTTFIFQQAAYHMAKPAQLKTHLTNITLDEDKVW